jgi:hypothetical protein
MRRSDILWLLGSCVLCACQATADEPVVTSDYYVAPHGSDQNPGTREQPFATLVRARDEVRKKIASGLRADVAVLIRGGTYELPDPVVFGPQDSGTDQHSVTYAAFPGERPIFSGGRKVSGWKRNEGQLWTAELAAVKEGKWYFRELFVGGQRRQRARTPKQGFFLVDGNVELKGENSTFRFHKGNLRRAWADAGDVEVVILQKWAEARLPLKSVDEAALIAGCAGKTSPYSAIGDAPYWVENVKDGLDGPGKWYLDRKTGVLSYWPLPGEDMNEAEVVAPVLAELIRFGGEPLGRDPVHHVRLRGLTFAFSDWSLPAAGFANGQAASEIPGAVRATYAISCTVEDCAFEHLGTYALELGVGCKHDRVVGNRMTDLGAGGVMVGNRGSHAEIGPRCSENVITNNHIHDAGTVYPGSVGILVMIAEGTSVAHNLVHDLPYSGISVGWSWDANPTDAQKNRIEYNHVHHVMKLLGDGAGIYTLGSQPGTSLRGNVIHDVERSAIAQGSANNGLYLDEGSKGFHIEGNVVYAVSGEPLFFHQTRQDWHRWGVNSFGVTPDSPNYPKEDAAKAGLEPSYRRAKDAVERSGVKAVGAPGPVGSKR